MPKLTIELVPSTCWFSNVRSQVSKVDWDKIRRESYQKANYKCEVCGGVGPKHPVECHEIWHYNDKTRVQKLVGMVSLCPQCHMVKHLGLAGILGKEMEARAHLKEVNSWTDDQAKKYIGEAFAKWDERSIYEWILNLSWLDKRSIKYRKRK